MRADEDRQTIIHRVDLRVHYVNQVVFTTDGIRAGRGVVGVSGHESEDDKEIFVYDGD